MDPIQTDVNTAPVVTETGVVEAASTEQTDVSQVTTGDVEQQTEIVSPDVAAATAEQTEKFREARAVQKGAYSGRRYLSDPPAGYRQPADTAPVDELGESEFKKEQRRKEAARKSKGGFRIWPF